MSHASVRRTDIALHRAVIKTVCITSLVVSKLATAQISDFHVFTESNFIHDCTSCVKTSYPKANQK